MEVECLHHQNVSFFPFLDDDAVRRHDCFRVRRSTEFDISSTKFWSLLSYQKVWYFHMSNTDNQNISRDEHRELEPRGCETDSRAGKGDFRSPIPDESNQHWTGEIWLPLSFHAKRIKAFWHLKAGNVDTLVLVSSTDQYFSTILFRRTAPHLDVRGPKSFLRNVSSGFH